MCRGSTPPAPVDELRFDATGDELGIGDRLGTHQTLEGEEDPNQPLPHLVTIVIGHIESEESRATLNGAELLAEPALDVLEQPRVTGDHPYQKLHRLNGPDASHHAPLLRASTSRAASVQCPSIPKCSSMKASRSEVTLRLAIDPREVNLKKSSRIYM